MQRIKQTGAGSYSVTVDTVNDDGVGITASAPYTVTVFDGAGAQITTGTPTHTDHILTYAIPANLITKLDTYRLVWTAVHSSQPIQWMSEVEIVGGYLFEIADLRDQDRTFTVEKYPSETLREVRSWVEDVIEGPRAANVAFVPRSSRVIVNGSARTALPLPDLNVRDVYAITVDGVAWTSTQIDTLTVDDGVLWLNADSPVSVWPAGHRNITLHYTHGHDRAPGAITRAALMLAKEYLVKSDVPGRATATSIGDQLFRLTIAGRDGVTGLPDVDAAIDQFGRKTYSVG